jgi:hypothetical protein
MGVIAITAGGFVPRSTDAADPETVNDTAGKLDLPIVAVSDPP